jgi:integrase
MLRPRPQQSPGAAPWREILGRSNFERPSTMSILQAGIFSLGTVAPAAGVHRNSRPFFRVRLIRSWRRVRSRPPARPPWRAGRRSGRRSLSGRRRHKILRARRHHVGRLGRLGGCGVRLRPHQGSRAARCAEGLRGTHASIAADAGESGIAVAQSLGHTSFATTTRHYATADAVAGGRQRRVEEALGLMESAENPPKLVPERLPS